MALTRSFLKGMNLTEEQVSAIVEAHTESLDGLKAERDKYKEAAKSVQSLEKEIEKLKSADGEDWEDRYNKEHEAFENYKKDVETKAESEKVRAAYKALLKSQNVSEKRIDTILKLTDFADLKLTKDGKIANEDKVVEKIKEEWSDLIGTQSEKGAGVDTPPSGGKSYASKEEIMKIRDASERQKAISENMELFGY